MEKDVHELLADYENAVAHVDVLRAEMAKQKDAILTPEQRMQMAEIDIEIGGQLEAAQEILPGLKKELQRAAVEHGESIRGEHFRVVYFQSKPTVNKDSMQQLLGYAQAHPEVAAFITATKPYVQVRTK